MSFAIRQDLLWCWGTSDSQSWKSPSSAISGSYQTVWTAVFLKPVTFSCNRMENCEPEFLPLLNALAPDNMYSSHNRKIYPLPNNTALQGSRIFFNIRSIHNTRGLFNRAGACEHLPKLVFTSIGDFGKRLQAPALLNTPQVPVT